MYQYIWDTETGGLLLTSEQSKFSKEPRPVYYRELNTLGFDRYWSYPMDDSAPIMWAEANNYIYRGRIVARTKGGSVYSAPEIVLTEEATSVAEHLQLVDISTMVEKNRELMNTLEFETIQRIYNTYREYKDKIDIFYVAFSGGKDSIVALDLTQKALPHDEFIVLFGDTQMEFPDTYKVVEMTEKFCNNMGIQFFKSQSRLKPSQTWKLFGPPAITNRWCCSVHKTSPQIVFLRKFLNKYDFTGMAFTGVRGEESLGRSEYDTISEGKKHNGQFSCHSILDWNSAEVFLYIFDHGLPFNEAYKKGVVRAGCLICPNSTGKNEFLKHVWYKNDVDSFLQLIESTSGKTNYSPEDMKFFIESGYWRTRKSGRELNFGQDIFETKPESSPPEIIVYRDSFNWQKWAYTVGEFCLEDGGNYVFNYADKLYQIAVDSKNGITKFSFINCRNEKNDIKFISLFKGAIVKSLYCVACGVCEAECKNNCIDMEHGVSISYLCVHCHNCQNMYESCLRYNSIRNKRMEGKQMTGIDRYFSFGSREDWLDIYCKYDGGIVFWDNGGDGYVVNKKKDAFKNFVLDAGLCIYDKKALGDKYTKCVPTYFASIIKKLGAGNDTSWALILCNLVYTPAFNWFVNAFVRGNSYTPDKVKVMLSDVMENDLKGLGKRNVLDSFKIFMAKTPLGTSRIFANCDIDEKKTGLNEKITLNSFIRCSWENPISEVILYSLYKFAKACGDYYQFTLETLMDESIERDGVSPTRIFGLDRETMVRILNGLAINYPDFISVSFTLDLNNITLRSDKTAADVLELF